MECNVQSAEAAPRKLTDTELEIISGGVRDNPYADALNQLAANRNKAQGTVGGSIGDPYVNGQPVF
jgi:hypothetical protein